MSPCGGSSPVVFPTSTWTGRSCMSPFISTIQRGEAGVESVSYGNGLWKTIDGKKVPVQPGELVETSTVCHLLGVHSSNESKQPWRTEKDRVNGFALVRYYKNGMPRNGRLCQVFASIKLQLESPESPQWSAIEIPSKYLLGSQANYLGSRCLVLFFLSNCRW